ncbi:lasso peptide biosynthesis B2 protein [Micromonospora sp. C51]|uniref:lasso peptide biosynthesis B2 protein n=1 Tax=Micromonospora sp. C51 TaxID=2824879 RepID=UPI001B367865|nr:lasso peptide biosynthesis B2 protein [Micromonospora sp. C51]MBQ1049528.1 lasso peptide biosynthesis B2 protein [Micromonospora sp. C51]
MADRLRPLTALLQRHGLRGLRIAVWTLRARRRIRRQLVRGGMDAVAPPVPPAGGTDDRTVVVRALHHAGANCLERSLVLQRWDARQRTARTLVIGVTAPSSGFHAHAWLAGDPDPHRAEMTELLRREPPAGWLPASAQERSTRP